VTATVKRGSSNRVESDGPTARSKLELWLSPPCNSTMVFRFFLGSFTQVKWSFTTMRVTSASYWIYRSSRLCLVLSVRAFVVSDASGELTLGVRDAQLAPRDETDILVKVDFSSVNFKDAMVATSPSRVRRVDTLIGGVDAAGTVRASLDEAYSPATE